MFRKRVVFGFVISRGLIFNLFNRYIAFSRILSRMLALYETEGFQYIFSSYRMRCEMRKRLLVSPMLTVGLPHWRRSAEECWSGVIQRTVRARK